MLYTRIKEIGDGGFATVWKATDEKSREWALKKLKGSDADEMARGEDFMHRLVERAQGMGGTCTGEHGIGQGKQKYLMAELGPEAIDAMRALKQALDPQNIFNPGKIVPAA